MTLEDAAAIATVVEAAAVVFGLLFAGAQVTAARATREDQARQAAEALRATIRPYVVAHLDGERRHGLVGLVIQNTGQTPAYDISFEIDPPLSDTVQHPGELTPLNQGVTFLAPGQRVTCEFEHVIGRSKDLPRRWDVVVRYRGMDGLSYEEPQALDFSHYWDAVRAQQKGPHEIAEQLEKLVKLQQAAQRRPGS